MPTQDPSTFLADLIGTGISASLTPAMHEREAQALGLRKVYQLFDLAGMGLEADALPGLLDAAQTLGFSGLNITHPCKQAVIPLLDALSPGAAALGAVNTVVFRNGLRIGDNTDWAGFSQSFTRICRHGSGPGGAAGRRQVAEIIYFPLQTELLRAARALGCRTLDGGGMAVFQAVEAFRLITGRQPDPERMLRHFDELTGPSGHNFRAG